MQSASPPWLHETAGRYELVADREAVKLSLASRKRHYVYVLHRPNGEPFYVGKGVAGRAFQHEAEARNTRRLTHKLNVIRAIRSRGLQVQYWIDSCFDSEALAHQRERELIALIGRHDLKLGPLTNQTDGGEGASNPSEENLRRRRESLWGDGAEDEERRIANRFFQQITSVRSVPIKPSKAFKAAAGIWVNDESIAMSVRQAAALAASAIQTRTMLARGAAIKRRFEVEGIEYIIENGAGRDALSSGMVAKVVGPETREELILSSDGLAYIISALGRDMLEDAGVLLPEA